MELVDNYFNFCFPLMRSLSNLVQFYMQTLPYQKEYAFSTGWKVFVIIFSVVFLTASGWMLYDGFAGKMGWFGLIAGPVGLYFSLYCVIRIFKERFTITEDRFIHVRVYTSRELLFDEVSGYRVDDNYIRIYNRSGKARIMLSSYISHKAEIIKKLAKRFKNLDVEEAIQARNELLNDTDYGFTPEQVEESIRRAKRISIHLNVAGVAAAIWAFAYPTPYDVVLMVNILLPIVAMAVTKTSNGLILLNDVKNSAKPNVVWAFLGPVLSLSLRLLFDFHIFSFSNMYALAGGLFVCTLVVLIAGSKEFNLSKAAGRASVFSLVFFLAIYCVLAVLTVNCLFDKTPAETYTAQVLDKRISRGKSTTYYLNLAPWGPQKEVDEVSVNRSFYDETNINDDVHLYYHKGLFNIPWFDVEK